MAASAEFAKVEVSTACSALGACLNLRVLSLGYCSAARHGSAGADITMEHHLLSASDRRHAVPIQAFQCNTKHT